MNFISLSKNKTKRRSRTPSRKRLLVIVGVGVFLIIIFLVFQKKIESAAFNEMMFRSYPHLASVRNTVLAKKYQASKPHRIRDSEDPRIQARAALLVHLKNGENRILFEKRPDQPLPVASLTKLMSGLVVLENYGLQQIVTISPEAAHKEGGPNFFNAGESFYVQDLLYSSLVESSNRAVFALAEKMGEERFVTQMNVRAQQLGMENTRFFNPTGLDPDLPHRVPNYSTARDLVKLAETVLDQKIVNDISTTRTRDIYQISGGFHHRIETTNEMLEELPGLALAKTGSTPRAGECLLVAFRNQNDGNITIGVVLGSENNFEDMKRLINWSNKAYRW